MLTQKYALDYGLRVKGIIINNYKANTIAEKTNPEVLRKFLEKITDKIFTAKRLPFRGLIKVHDKFFMNYLLTKQYRAVEDKIFNY